MRIRKMLPEDKNSVMKILRDTGMFSYAEISVAEELIDIFISGKPQNDYIIYIAEDENSSEIYGYVCYGPTPATEGTFDLYWIAVSPEKQGKGIGATLLKFVEDKVKSAGGRLLIIETSSREKYRPTQNFYLKNAYIIEARIKDFYSIGDDRLIFTKRF
ncbi:MAG: GNAT family N-acetyltransferase [Candidatus Nanoarchaeia archaeon]